MAFLLPSRLLTSLLLCLLMAAFWSTTNSLIHSTAPMFCKGCQRGTSAFVTPSSATNWMRRLTPPPCPSSSSSSRQVKAATTRMMAERFYNKWSRADFVLKSALAAAAVIPVIKGGAMARDAQAPERVAVPIKRVTDADDEDKDSPFAFSAQGVPLRFPLHKSQEQALSELQEVVARVGGRLTKGRGGAHSDVLRAAFQSKDMHFCFGGEGGSSGYSRVLQASVGSGVDDMRLMNALADGLASKGWLAAGYPLSCDAAIGQYYS